METVMTIIAWAILGTLVGIIIGTLIAEKPIREIKRRLREADINEEKER